MRWNVRLFLLLPGTPLLYDTFITRRTQRFFILVRSFESIIFIQLLLIGLSSALFGETTGFSVISFESWLILLTFEFHSSMNGRGLVCGLFGMDQLKMKSENPSIFRFGNFSIRNHLNGFSLIERSKMKSIELVKVEFQVKI